MSNFIKLILVLAALAGLCSLYGFFIEPKFLKTRQVMIKSDNYMGSSLRIVLLSDIHIGGRHVPATRVNSIVNRVNELNPDIILIPGDFINGHKKRDDHSQAFNSEIEGVLTALKGLSAPLGVYASIGNHDVWYDAKFVQEILETVGLTVLSNKAVNLSNKLCIVGYADHDTQSEDISTFNGCHEGALPIALMHSPDSFPFLRSDTVLAVAGHTHGGQINLPLIGRRVTATAAGRKYAYGLVDVNGIPAFVTAGIGTSILPARFRSF